MNYFDELERLLKMEQEEDRDQYRNMTAQSGVVVRRMNGVCWYPVAIRSSEPGKGDYLTIELERTTHHEMLHQLRAGMPASLFSNHNKEDVLEGTISWLSGNRLKLALRHDELPDWTRAGKLGVDLLFDQNSYDEMFTALKAADNLSKDQAGRLVNVLTGKEPPAFLVYSPQPHPVSLNQVQQLAVEKMLSAEDIAIVHGPPGTGKTTTLVAAIKRLSQKSGQILVTAPSNAAVDLLTEKLSVAGLKVVRVGNPARISEQMLSFTLDDQLSNHQLNKEIKRLRKQAAAYRDMAHKYKRNFGAAERAQRKALFDEAHKVMKEVERLEEYVGKTILDEAQVITATLVGANNYNIRNRQYECIVIDEAGQSLEPACWIPVLKGRKLIMAGDHHQLPPTIKSDIAAREGLSDTLFEKVIRLWPDAVVMLEEQYRMHQDIMQFSSATFYENKLVAHEAVAAHKLYEEDIPLLFIDTAGCGFEEKEADTSMSNPEEAALLIRHLQMQVETLSGYYEGREFPSIAIVAPYRQQVLLLQDLLRGETSLHNYHRFISVNTVDSFQGQERDIVYISLTRSNVDNKIGFLNDVRRMNVAMTRARKKLVVIGDSGTIAAYPFYASFISWAEETGGWKSAWEWMEV